MKFEFAKYTDVTDYAKELNNDFFGQYERVLICPDTNDAWVSKILVGYDDNYDRNEDKVLIERNMIDGWGAKFNNIRNPRYAKNILTNDANDGSNWDVYECDSVDEAIEILDDGYGIIEED